MAKCKSCGAEIDWIKLASGKNMPVNSGLHYFKPRTWELDFSGFTKYVTTSGLVKTGRRLVIDESAEGAELGHISHWETCPYADKHRRRD